MPIPVGAIIGGGMALAGALDMGGNARRKKQVEQQKKLNDVNAETSKELADYEQALKLKMWQDTNYGAQLAEANKAGVSKAAAIGGGVGGTQGASVGGISGGGGAEDASSQLQANSGRMMAGIQMAQLSLLEAQKENIDADTENKKASAGKAGMETVKGGAETEGIQLDNKLKDQTLTDKVKNIAYTAEQEAHKQQIMFNERKISDATLKDNITRIKAEAVGQVLNNTLTKANTGLTEERIKQVREAIKQEWAEIGLKGRQVTNQELMDGVRNRLTERGISLGEDALNQKAFQDAANSVIQVGGMATGNMPSTETTTGSWTNSNGDWGQSRQQKKKN